MTTPAFLSIVIPMFNESENVLRLLDESQAVLKKIGAGEIICIDDSSDDNTFEMLNKARNQWPVIEIAKHQHRCGQSAALWTGLQMARGDWIATLDGDGQNNPADIPKLIEALANNPELSLVAGQRAERQDHWKKRVTSKIANAVRARLLRDRTPDTGCGLKLIKKTVLPSLPYFDHMHRYLPALIQRAGGKIMSVPVSHRSRKHGKSKYGTWDRLRVGIVDLFGVAWLQRRAHFPALAYSSRHSQEKVG